MSALFNHYFFNEPQVISEQEYRLRKRDEEIEWQWCCEQASQQPLTQNRFILQDGQILEGENL